MSIDEAGRHGYYELPRALHILDYLERGTINVLIEVGGRGTAVPPAGTAGGQGCAHACLSPAKAVLSLIHDTVMAGLAFALAMLLRLGIDDLFLWGGPELMLAGAVAMATAFMAFLGLRTYDQIWRFAAAPSSSPSPAPWRWPPSSSCSPCS